MHTQKAFLPRPGALMTHDRLLCKVTATPTPKHSYLCDLHVGAI